MFFSNIPFQPNVTCLNISMCRSITIGSFAMTRGFWPAIKTFNAGTRSAVGNVSGYRCVSDCRSRGREFDPGPVPYFRGD